MQSHQVLKMPLSSEQAILISATSASVLHLTGLADDFKALYLEFAAASSNLQIVNKPKMKLKKELSLQQRIAMRLDYDRNFMLAASTSNEESKSDTSDELATCKDACEALRKKIEKCDKEAVNQVTQARNKLNRVFEIVTLAFKNNQTIRASGDLGYIQQLFLEGLPADVINAIFMGIKHKPIEMLSFSKIASLDVKSIFTNLLAIRCKDIKFTDITREKLDLVTNELDAHKMTITDANCYGRSAGGFLSLAIIDSVSGRKFQIHFENMAKAAFDFAEVIASRFSPDNKENREEKSSTNKQLDEKDVVDIEAIKLNNLQVLTKQIVKNKKTPVLGSMIFKELPLQADSQHNSNQGLVVAVPKKSF